MKDNRIIDILNECFSEYAFPSNLPIEDDIEISKFDSIKDDTFLIELINDGFRFDYLGDNIVKTFEIDHYSDGIDGFFSLEEGEFLERLKEIRASRIAISNEGEFINSDDIRIKFRMKLFPIAEGANNKIVKRIFGGIRWKMEA